MFPQDQVNQITITIDPENWAAMQANMTQLLGAPHGRGGGRAGAAGSATAGRRMRLRRPARCTSRSGDSPHRRVNPEVADRRGGAAGGGRQSRHDPGQPDVGQRHHHFQRQDVDECGRAVQGQLDSDQGVGQGSAKLPLKLDFDQFEDEHPEIENQRFYGFKQLALANNLMVPPTCATPSRTTSWKPQGW